MQANEVMVRLSTLSPRLILDVGDPVQTRRLQDGFCVNLIKVAGNVKRPAKPRTTWAIGEMERNPMKRITNGIV
jgi:hypothetical protein